MATSFLEVKNRAESTLASAITAAATSLSVAAGEGANFPSSGTFHITINDEILACTSRSTDTLTVTRAAQGTSAAAHSADAVVSLNVTAQNISDLNTAVNAIENAKGVASGLASLNASTKVVEQPASITDHLEDTVTNISTKAPTSKAVFGMSRKNAIINGDMNIWQRGTSFDNPNGIYTADRWKTDSAVDTNVKLLRSTTVPDASSSYSLRVEVMTATGGAGSYSDIKQQIEDYVFFRGKTVTLSCYVKCDAGVSGNILIVDSVGSDITAISATTWTKYTVTRTIDAAATSLYPLLQITRDGQVVGKGINFAQAQLEVGSVATPFEFRPYQQELALCQRYYEKQKAVGNNPAYAIGYCYTTTEGHAALRFVTKRAAPTTTVSAVDDFALQIAATLIATTNITFSLTTLDCVKVVATVAAGLTAGAGCFLLGDATTDSWIAFSSEL